MIYGIREALRGRRGNPVKKETSAVKVPSYNKLECTVDLHRRISASARVEKWHDIESS